MLLDLHVHTKRYSPCGRATPEEMVARAIEVGLDGVVITEHHVLWGAKELAALQARFPQIKLLRGIEITSPEGDDYLIYGVTDPAVFARPIDPAPLLSCVRELGGAVILPHPYRYRDAVPALLDRQRIDGVEVMSYNILNYAHPKAQALAERLGVPMVAASDAHHPDALGRYAVRLRHPVADERELAVALRRGEFGLHVDVARVATQNAELAARCAEAHRLMAQDYPDEAIREQVPGMTLTMLRGIREGLDVYWPC